MSGLVNDAVRLCSVVWNSLPQNTRWVPYATILKPILNYFKTLDEKTKILLRQLFLEEEREFNFVFKL